MNRNPRLFIKKLLITLASVIVIGYAIFNARLLIWGPQINDVTPPDSTVFKENFITISGSTKNITEITLNDKMIFVDEEGLFSKDILLLPGLNVLELYGKDKFGRDTTRLLNYIYEGDVSEPLVEIMEIEEVATSSEEEIIE